MMRSGGICFPTAGAERGRHVEPGGRKLTAAVTTRRPRAGLSLKAPFVTGRGRCVESTHHGSLCPILQPWRKINTSTGTAFRDPPRPLAMAPRGRPRRRPRRPRSVYAHTAFLPRQGRWPGAL